MSHFETFYKAFLYVINPKTCNTSITKGMSHRKRRRAPYIYPFYFELGSLFSLVMQIKHILILDKLF